MKQRRVFLPCMLLLCLVLFSYGLTSCSGRLPLDRTGGEGTAGASSAVTAPSFPEAGDTSVLVAYFSCTGTTEGIARTIAAEAEPTGSRLTRVRARPLQTALRT